MGFTKFEKESLKLLLRSEEETEKLRDAEISDEAREYLKNSDLRYYLKDYSLFPKKFVHRVNKAENIIIIKFFNQNMDIHDELMKITSVLTPVYRIQVDCGFLIINGSDPEKEKLRIAFAQRSLALNDKIHINSSEDVEKLLDEFKTLDRYSLMKKVFALHQNQSCFEKSGYRPYCLLNLVFFLAKI